MHKCLPITALVAVLLAGCGITSVSPERRDLSGRFDGRWRGQLALNEEFQSYGHWEFTCSKFVTGIEMNVSDGYADARILNGEDPDIRFRTAIDADGRLFHRVALPDGVAIEFGGRLDPGGGAGGGDAVIKGDSGFPYGCKAQWRVLRRT